MTPLSIVVVVGTLAATVVFAFVVDAAAPGFSIAERIDLIAPHPMATLSFKNCRISAAQRIGTEGDGFKIAILSSSGEGEALAGQLGGVGVTGSNQSLDDLKRLVDTVFDRWGRIDVLVNSAGHGPRAPILSEF